MFTLEEMLTRLAIAIVLGAIVGVEREIAGKEAGIRTDILVAGGATIFSMVALALPGILVAEGGNLADILAHNGGFLSIIANVVVGIGFLGAGIIVKHGVHVRGLTTAASVWFVAAIGVLVGIGLLEFATIAALGLSLILEVLRRLNVYRFFGKKGDDEIDRETQESSDPA